MQRMPLKMTHRKAEDVPQPPGAGKGNDDLRSLKDELAKVSTGMVLEVDTGNEQDIRRTKVLITKAGRELGRPFRHWHEGTRVFAKPVDGARRRGRPRKNPV